ncbi:retrovirus-related pol polyprotein from transposon TNT 1-94 [Tanacetum coccineum]
MKGKYVDTKFEKPSVVRQPNAFKFQKPSVLGKPTPFSNSPFSNSRLKSKTSNVKSVCATCGKYVFHLIHDACVSMFINDVNARTKKPNVVPISARKPTRKANQSVGNDLLTGNRGSDLYTISLQETSLPTPICFLAKALPTQAWLWRRRLSHLNFDTINLLSNKDIANGLLKLKYVKDQLCLSCEMGKAKSSSFKTKIVPSSKGQLNLLHMDLYGPMQIEGINGKKYISVIVDDFSRYTWSHFLRSKDETLEVLKDFLKMIQRNLQAQALRPTTKESDHNCSELKIQDHNNEPSSLKLVPNVVPSTDTTTPSLQELDLLFSPLFEEYFTTGNKKVAESSSRNVDTSNMHTFYQHHRSDYHWTKDHPFKQVHGNLSKHVQTRRQLSTGSEMCMLTLIEELHQFDRLKVWKLVDKSFGKTVISVKWLWKNKKDEDNTVIRNNARLVAKGYAQEEGLWYPKDSGFELIAFSNTNHARCLDTHKSTPGGIHFLGEKLVSWMSKKQDYTAMPTTEAEYVALFASCAQVMWMGTHLKDYGFDYNRIPLNYDS